MPDEVCRHWRFFELRGHRAVIAAWRELARRKLWRSVRLVARDRGRRGAGWRRGGRRLPRRRLRRCGGRLSRRRSRLGRRRRGCRCRRRRWIGRRLILPCTRHRGGQSGSGHQRQKYPPSQNPESQISFQGASEPNARFESLKGFQSGIAWRNSRVNKPSSAMYARGRGQGVERKANGIHELRLSKRASRMRVMPRRTVRSRRGRTRALVRPSLRSAPADRCRPG